MKKEQPPRKVPATEPPAPAPAGKHPLLLALAALLLAAWLAFLAYMAFIL